MGAAHSIDADAGEPERGWSVAEPPADVFLCVLAQLRRDWPARAAMRATCRGWARLAGDELTWKALCGAHGLCLCAAWVCSTLFALTRTLQAFWRRSTRWRCRPRWRARRRGALCF
jgi:hypothetical protein